MVVYIKTSLSPPAHTLQAEIIIERPPSHNVKRFAKFSTYIVNHVTLARGIYTRDD